jgi:glycosyltransferase involved in cell wall biosynthesis
MNNFFFAPISSFYRNNLYNELTQKCKFTVIYFYKNQHKFRSKDFIDNNSQYKKINYYKLSLINKIFLLKKILLNFRKKKIFICGWNKIEYWLVLIFCINSKKIFVCDSFESKNNRYSLLKKIFLSMIDCVIVPGTLHKNFIKNLNFNKKILVTSSVGIIEPLKKNKFYLKKKKKIKIIYVGRISKEKNLRLLFELIQRSNNLNLSIFGKDENKLEQTLSKKIKNKIKFKGSILNNKIKFEIKKYDLLILPSKFEPWGLVIEEAIYNGIPVISSNKVGCYFDLIKKLKVGYVFNNDSLQSLQKCVNKFRNAKNLRIINKNLSSLNYNLFKKKHIHIYENIMTK